MRIFFIFCNFLFAFMIGNAQEVQNRPNIIFILADDLGMGDVSCFNKNGKIATPNIDKIAENGILFTDAHSSAAVCTPTRYGFLTGRYNWRSRLKEGVLVQFDKPLIEQGRTNMASMLKSKGYQTAAIGKWHLGWDWTTKNGMPPAIDDASRNIPFSMTSSPIVCDKAFILKTMINNPVKTTVNDAVKFTAMPGSCVGTIIFENIQDP